MSHWLSWSVSINTLGTLLTFAFVLVLSIVVRKLYNFRKFFQLCQSIPGDKNYSIIYGNLQNLPPSYEGVIADMQNYMTNVNNRIKRFWLGPFDPLIILLHPEPVKEFLKTAAPKTRGFGGGYEHSVPWLGESVLTSNGARWYRDRRLINNAFHHGVLKNYVPLFNSAADTLLNIMETYADTGESFDIFKLSSLCLFDIITKSAMSLDVDAQRQKHPFVAASRQLTSIWALRNKTITLWPNIVFRLSSAGRTFFKTCKYVHQIANDIIATRSEALHDTSAPTTNYADFLDLLLRAKDDDGNTMTALQVRENVDAIMFAGHDTGSSSTAWFLYEMARCPDYQRLVQREVDSILDGRDCDQLQLEDLNHLRQLTMCLKETMRLHPAVPTLSRRIVEPTVIEGTTFPAGTIVSVPIMYIQRNPAVWDRPLEYMPERFAPESAKNISPMAYLPFSAGSRNCAGQHFAMMELKVLLGRILRRFDLELDPHGPKIEKIYEMVTKAKDGIWMKARLRK